MAAVAEAHDMAELRRELAATRAELRALRDRAEIQDLLNTYCRGIDRADLEVTQSVFHAGSVDRHGMFEGSGEEFATFITPYTRANYRMMQHHHTTTSFDIRGDEAGTETYFLCVQSTPDGDLEFSSGRVADRFERRQGRWGIVERQVIMDWTWFVPRDAAVPTSLDGQFVRGAFAEDDASYQALPTLRGTAFAR